MKSARSLEFDIAACEDLAWWIERDRQKALRIMSLIKDMQRDPFKGIGKPEPLKHELKGSSLLIYLKAGKKHVV